MPASQTKRKNGKRPPNKGAKRRVSAADALRLQPLDGVVFNNDEPARSAPAEPQSYDDKFVPTTWGQAPNAAFLELTVPSGQTCLVRTVGVQGLMAAGILNHVDGLTAIVDQKYVTKREDGRAAINAKALAEDEDAIKTVFDVINRVTCHCVMMPKIEPVPKIKDSAGNWIENPDPDARVPGVVYVDTVPEEDQMFIFNAVCGGTRDLERFRNESEAAVGGVVLGPDVEGPPE